MAITLKNNINIENLAGYNILFDDTGFYINGKLVDETNPNVTKNGDWYYYSSPMIRFKFNVLIKQVIIE